MDETYTPTNCSIGIKDAPILINFLEHSERGPEISIMDLGDDKSRGGYLVIHSGNLIKYSDKGLASSVIRELYHELDKACDMNAEIGCWNSALQIMGKYLEP